VRFKAEISFSSLRLKICPPIARLPSSSLRVGEHDIYCTYLYIFSSNVSMSSDHFNFAQTSEESVALLNAISKILEEADADFLVLPRHNLSSVKNPLRVTHFSRRFAWGK
jgi:hypothetical protein